MSWVLLVFALVFMGWLGWVRRARQQRYLQVERALDDWAASRGFIDVTMVEIHEGWGFPNPPPPRVSVTYRRVGGDPELVAGTVVDHVFKVAPMNSQALISEEPIEFEPDDALVLLVSRRVKELSPEPDWIEQIARMLDQSAEKGSVEGGSTAWGVTSEVRAKSLKV